MLKQFLVGGAVIAGLAGFASPALADGDPRPHQGIKHNTGTASDNIIICGNQGIGDVALILLNLVPVNLAHNQPVDCSITVKQE
ncbi:hypothetical protein [Thermoactinospora rubra]|uniref:hypothetical protein n=1 Tax=Thermoactinospora rubra TaxID=1088767 RepID=UPI000A113C12|nr:hypothetical protein [Thermoactinospora rubra]